jgi:signal transduction histidine kinase
MISAFPHEAPEPLVSTRTESCDPPDAARDALAVFAHELRSPLSAALQGLQLLCLSRADQAAQARALDLIQRQLRHAARLVEVTLADARGRSVAGSGAADALLARDGHKWLPPASDANAANTPGPPGHPAT